MTPDDGEQAADPVKRGRGRDATATRAAILAAARRAFTNESYGQVGLRDIAAEAGIDPALVIRYFGSKEGLFAAAVGQKFEKTPPPFAGERATLGERLARYVLTKPPAAEGFDPMLALLRSAPGDEPGRLLRIAFDEEFAAPLVMHLDGADREIRADLICAVLLGVLVSRSLIRPTALTGVSSDALIPTVAAIVQQLVDGV